MNLCFVNSKFHTGDIFKLAEIFPVPKLYFRNGNKGEGWRLNMPEFVEQGQCYHALQEAWEEFAVPYRTVELWVKVFNEGPQNVADMRWLGQPSIHDEEIHTLADWHFLLDSNRCHAIRELPRGTGLEHTTVLHVLKDHSEFFRQ